MIQVLERINHILDVVAENPEGVALKDIVSATGLNKATICNLLKSLSEIDYVRKKQNGIYLIGEKFIKLAYPHFINDSLVNIAEKIVATLVTESREAGLVAVRKNDSLQVIAKKIYDQSVVINTKVFDTLPGYHTAVGHLFMAYDPQIDPAKIYQEKLREVYSSFEDLEKFLANMREQGYLFMPLHGGQTQAIAAPVFSNDTMIAALVLVAPTMRMTDEKREDFTTLVRKYAEMMSVLLK